MNTFDNVKILHSVSEIGPAGTQVLYVENTFFFFRGRELGISLAEGTSVGPAYLTRGVITGFEETYIYYTFQDYTVEGLEIPVGIAVGLASQGPDIYFGQLFGGSDLMTGGTAGDLLRSYGGNDSLAGLAGGDDLAGGDGADTISGGEGADTVSGGEGTNYLRGDEGNDSIVGGTGFDDINGNMGNDTCVSGGGDDWVVGGRDNDSLVGSTGQNLVYGNIGADTCEGGDGNDIVRGGQDNDVINGGEGDDYVSGDKGSDTVTGGAGADVFHTFGDAGLDRVLDFSLAQGDRVQVDPGTQYTVSQIGSDTVIDMTGGGQMILVGVQMSSLTPSWIFGA